MKVHFCYVVIFYLCSSCEGFKSKFPENANWACSNCGNLSKIVFGLVRHAMYYESRESFLNYEHAWIDDALKIGRKVNVSLVTRDALATHVSEIPLHPESKATEVFHAIVSLPPFGNNSRPLEPQDAYAIDDFLSKNPCWIPLHEPPIRLVSLPTPFQRNRPSQLRRNLYRVNDNLDTNSKSVIGDQNKRDLSENNGEFLKDLKHLYDYSLIFIRLPSYPYHATCSLYTLVTEKQNPLDCPAAGPGSYIVNHLGNIGWANCVHPLMEHLMDSLHNDKVHRCMWFFYINSLLW